MTMRERIVAGNPCKVIREIGNQVIELLFGQAVLFCISSIIAT